MKNTHTYIYAMGIQLLVIGLAIMLADILSCFINSSKQTNHLSVLLMLEKGFMIVLLL